MKNFGSNFKGGMMLLPRLWISVQVWHFSFVFFFLSFFCFLSSLFFWFVSQFFVIQYLACPCDRISPLAVCLVTIPRGVVRFAPGMPSDPCLRPPNGATPVLCDILLDNALNNISGGVWDMMHTHPHPFHIQIQSGTPSSHLIIFETSGYHLWYFLCPKPTFGITTRTIFCSVFCIAFTLLCILSFAWFFSVIPKSSFCNVFFSWKGIFG